MTRVPGRAEPVVRTLALIAVVALLAACGDGDDPGSEGGELGSGGEVAAEGDGAATEDAGADGAETQEEPADGGGAAEADDDTAADVDADDGAAADDGADAGDIGVIRVGGQEYVLASATRCEPREMIGEDGEIVFHTFAFGPDMAYGINVWEQVVDGVTAHRLTSDAEGLMGLYEQIVAEGEPGYPLFQLEGDRIVVEGELATVEREPVEVSAEWLVPADERPC